MTTATELAWTERAAVVDEEVAVTVSGQGLPDTPAEQAVDEVAPRAHPDPPPTLGRRGGSAKRLASTCRTWKRKP